MGVVYKADEMKILVPARRQVRFLGCGPRVRRFGKR